MEKKCCLPFHQGVILISGATRSGKTHFVYKMLANLKEQFHHPQPVSILFCYAIYQPLYEKIETEIPNVEMHHGLPSENKIDEWCTEESVKTHRLIILDDLSHLIVDNRNIELLLTQGSHHKNISVIIVTQNIFNPGKYSRSQSLNTQYFIIFRNIRDGNQIKYLSRQLFPSFPNKLVHAYEDSIKEKHGYLLIDMHPYSDDKYRLRTKILYGEDCIVYKDS